MSGEKAHSSSQKKEKEICLYLCYSGVVQGVGFRYTAASLASRYGIKGWVRNTPQGNVDMIAQGLQSQVESFIQSLNYAFSSNITSLEREERALDRSLRGFEIKFFSPF